MTKSKSINISNISRNENFKRIKRLFLLKLRNIDKLKLFDFIMNNERWVKIEIN